MVHTQFLPGWTDFAALISHLKFVKDHHSKIEKVAAVSDSGFLRNTERCQSFCENAAQALQLYDDKDKALEWLVNSCQLHGFRKIFLVAPLGHSTLLDGPSLPLASYPMQLPTAPLSFALRPNSPQGIRTAGQLALVASSNVLLAAITAFPTS